MEVRSLKNESHSKPQDDTHPNPSMSNITYVQPAISVATSPSKHQYFILSFSM
ncbi:hypothetical protein RhiirA5_423004 [Rhizophagus irregularis]|uniref:Uncharacterized protein n=1 Tax=Rhizophagus irregularis TaxID=588596 RepID=A0A2N0PAT2_9GLOM|nr:hypothetical protein RhiirA5_423004 [Rhizophagus irregularis]